jgi:hypothetical protein
MNDKKAFPGKGKTLA